MPHPNIGKYRLTSLISNIALDLNYDNIKSTDFKQELSVFFNNPIFSPKFALRLNEIIVYDDTLAFELLLPGDGYYQELEYLDLRFAVQNYSKAVVVEDSNFVKITHHSDFDLDGISDTAQEIIDGNYPYPYHLEFNSDSKVTVYIKQNFFDLEKDEWVLVELVGVFEKAIQEDI
ncbi:hypothetical protein JCM19538_1956 [Jejuia pallidilutea]|uniref:Uncharacterized protein n=2 Tax=Jejuia pallidilutea TaxID=504487 RepID=A0A098LRF4_9FLAO|nr:hypothetical protein JCM19538_1956 [Jejuia pallidilutea]